jgi:peptide/nickel transport system permease protein
MMMRVGPSLVIAIPSLIVGVMVNITCALFVVFFRRTYLDPIGVFSCILLMSISMLFYIVGGQYLISKVLKMVPISGYERGWSLLRFLILPIVINVIAGIGAGTRWYRALFLEEINKDYVRTARAKGISEIRVLFYHVLPNGLIPIMTGVVALLPLLFMGSLLTESFFGIPGMGSYTIDAIQQQDFAIVRAMVFWGSILYMVGLLLTDFVYTWVDPRVRFE